MKILNTIDEALSLLVLGQLIAYPTETVYGLGCDPFNQKAVSRLLALKKRDVNKGLILLIRDWSQLTPLIEAIPASQLEWVKSTWPGPITWVFPKSLKIPLWVSGDHPGIAIRMSAHGVAKALCVKGPIISTSANITSLMPALNSDEVIAQFPDGIDAIIPGTSGGGNPSAIYDALSGRQLR